MCVNDCLSLCHSHVIDWRPVQGVPAVLNLFISTPHRNGEKRCVKRRRRRKRRLCNMSKRLTLSTVINREQYSLRQSELLRLGHNFKRKDRRERMDRSERGVNAAGMYENLIQPPGEEVCFSPERAREAEGLCQGSHHQSEKTCTHNVDSSAGVPTNTAVKFFFFPVHIPPCQKYNRNTKNPA